jgi:hypothetical protein
MTRSHWLDGPASNQDLNFRRRTRNDPAEPPPPGGGNWLTPPFKICGIMPQIHIHSRREAERRSSTGLSKTVAVKRSYSRNTSRKPALDSQPTATSHLRPSSCLGSRCLYRGNMREIQLRFLMLIAINSTPFAMVLFSLAPIGVSSTRPLLAGKRIAGEFSPRSVLQFYKSRMCVI